MSLVSLAERQRNDGISLNSMIVLSALLHALLLFVVLFSPSLPTQKRTFGPAYTVDLVSMPAKDPQRGAARIPFEQEIKVGTRDPAVITRRTVEAEKVIPIERIQVHRREAPGRVDEAIRQIEQRVAASRTSESAPRAPETTDQQRAAQTSSTGERAAEDRMNAYYSGLWIRIRDQWALPELILKGEQLEAVLAVTIKRDGALDRLVFEQKSGNSLFDESAEKAVKKAAPFPALPGWLNEPHIDVGIRFRSSEF